MWSDLLMEGGFRGLQEKLRILFNEFARCGILNSGYKPEAMVTGEKANVDSVLESAIMAGHSTFRRPPQLVFVVLPDTGAPLLLYRPFRTQAAREDAACIRRVSCIHAPVH